MEMESLDGSKKGYIHHSNVEPYEGGNPSRPESIEDYISQNNIASYNSETIETKANEYKREAESAGYSTINNLFQTAMSDFSMYEEGGGGTQQIMDDARSKYEEYRSSVAYIDGDAAFHAVAHIYSWVYYHQSEVDDQYGEITDDTDLVAEFEEAYNDYQAAVQSGDRDAQNVAWDRMQQLYDRMNGDETGTELSNGMTVEEAYRNTQDQDLETHTGSDITYYAPNLTTSGTDSGQSLDDMINDGDAFIGHSDTDVLNTQELQDGVSTLYNIFLEVGVAAAVIIGLIIGIKFMIGSVEEKAEIKKLLWPYAIGCFVVFGAFGIWKIVLEIMQSV